MQNKSIENQIILRSISQIESNAREIRPYCFYDCTNLMIVNFGNATKAGDFAFYGCTNAGLVVSIPKLMEIGAYCFSSSAIPHPNFPAVLTVGASAFQNCSNIILVTLPSAKTIYSYAFSGCSNLATLSLPNAETIGDYAFQNCSNLATLSLPNAETIGAKIAVGSSNCDVHLYTKLKSIGAQGEAGLTSYVPPKAFYLHFEESDSVQFVPENMIGVGSSKKTLTYNIYTNNSTIKNAVLSKVDQYTIVNVYHLDGSDW